jgi:uncharacterized membrane protein YgcG
MKRPFLMHLGISSKKYVAILAMVFISAAPATVFCQEQEEEQQPIEQPTVDPNPVDVNTGTLNTSPWPSGNNNANNNTGTVDRSTGAAARPNTNSAQRPGNGGTVLSGPGGGGGFGGGGTGGNPDVPFDDNMNIGFLIVGLVFAFVVYRKRFSIKYK